MRRVAAVLMGAGLLAAVPLSHLVLAGGRPEDKPAPKVVVCHLDAETGVSHYIEVAPQAVQAHMKHGDCLGVDSSNLGDNLCECPAPSEPEPEG